MDGSFYTRVGEGKYEVHFETGEKWKYVLVEAACREAIGHGKALMVTENIVRCGECKYWSGPVEFDGKLYGQCQRPISPIMPTSLVNSKWYCADGEREVQE